MPGFEVDTDVLRLVFEDDLEGMVVRIESMSTGDMLDLTKAAAHLARKFGRDFDMSNLEPADLESMSVLFERFAEALVEWNLEKKKVPIPATLAGVRSLKQSLTMRLIMAWMQAGSGVPDPLAGGSGSGGTFPEASLPMEPLLTSP